MRARNFETLATFTNKAADTYYYPDATGLDASGSDKLGFDIVSSGGVTVTIEEMSAEATPTPVDITKSFVSKNLGTTAVSYVDKTDIIEATGMFGRVRVKVVTSDNSNYYHIRKRQEGGDLVR